MQKPSKWDSVNCESVRAMERLEGMERLPERPESLLFVVGHWETIQSPAATGGKTFIHHTSICRPLQSPAFTPVWCQPTSFNICLPYINYCKYQEGLIAFYRAFIHEFVKKLSVVLVATSVSNAKGMGLISTRHAMYSESFRWNHRQIA